MPDDRAYRTNVSFDPEKERFIARAPELDAEAIAETRTEAIESLEREIEKRIEEAATNNEDLPGPLDAEPVPESLTLEIAAPVFRDLRHHANQSGTTPESFAAQLLARAIGELESGRAREARSTRPREEEPQPDRRRDREDDRPRGKGRRREGYRPEIENQANFLEYVRQMEKGGGGRGRR